METFSVYEASDYAGIDVPTKGIKFYYGYEVTDDDENWCFEATFPQKKIKIGFPILKHENASLDQFECVPCLLTGIAILIERGDFKPA
jgi:hypothetical protein